MNLKGKKLLLVGGSNSAEEIKSYADKHGIILLATGCGGDTPLKKIAHKAYEVDTMDLNGMLDLAKKAEIDGIFAGGNEPNIGVAIEIAEAMKLPFYVTKEQFELNRDKNHFKATCRKFGLKVPEDYTLTIDFLPDDLSKIRYPVIVKPVDSCGGNGVAVCENEDELRKNFTIAYNSSPSHRALVEEYVSGDEITAVYTLQDGKISLSCLKDKIISHDHPFIASQADALVTPSKYLDDFYNGDNKKVLTMLSENGFKNGTLFLQGIARASGITFFEMGCRIGGGADYRTIANANKINFLEMLLCFSVTGVMGGYDLSEDTPFFPKICCVFNMWIHGGKIARQTGVEQVRMIPGVTRAEYMHDVGDTVPNDGSMKQKVFRAYITVSSRAETAEIIKKIQKCVEVSDSNGNSMLYKPFDTARLL